MGKFVAHVGEWELMYGDYQWDYVKRSQPKEYYENYKFNGNLFNGRTKENIEVEIPFLELAEIYLLKKYYGFAHKEEDSPLRRVLWRIVVEEMGYVPEVCVYVMGNLGRADTYRNDWKEYYVFEYHLQSEIGDNNVILGLERKRHIIKNYDDFEWLNKHLMDTDWEKI